MKQHTDKLLRINFLYTNKYPVGGWVRINPKTFIRPSGTKQMFSLVKAEGMPIAPQAHHFKNKGEKLSFSLFFPAIPREVKKIDLIEEEDDYNSFNYYNIPVKNLKKKRINIDSLKKQKIKFNDKKIYAAEMVCNGYYPNEKTVAVLRQWYNSNKKYFNYQWHILDRAGDSWNNYETFEEAWKFQGMNMREKKVFNNQKDFFKWTYSLVKKNKIY